MLIDTTTTETASNLESRIAGLNAKIVVASNVGSTVAYSANGLILRSKESVVTTEYRGLTKAAAEKLLTLSDNDVSTTIYYKKIGSGDEYAAVGVSVGLKSDYTMSRVNDSNTFVVTRVDTTYSAADDGGWSSVRPSSSGTGVVTSKSKRSSHVCDFDGDALYSYQEDTTTEFRFLTQSEAVQKVAAEASDTVTETMFKHDIEYQGQTMVGFWIKVQTGTRKVAAARYVDADHGFTVTVNQTTLTASGTGFYT